MDDMTLIIFMQGNIFALIILSVIYLNTKRYSSKYILEQNIYIYLLLSNAFMLTLDIVRVYINGKTGYLFREINMISSGVMLGFTPLVTMIWTIYIDYKIHMDKERLKKRFIPMVLPTAINIVLILLSFMGGINGKVIFYIDEANIYHRGNIYNVMVLISYLYLFYSFISIVLNKKKVDSMEYKTLGLFAVPPFIGGILQSMIFGLKLTWLSLTLSIFIVFVNIQNNLLYVDVLTGLYNRRNLEKYLKNIFSEKSKSKNIGGILLDINDFKIINDTYGHDEGDKALISASKILKSSFSKDDFISRYAGDEFVVVCEVFDYNELQSRIDKLENNIKKFNETGQKLYKLSLSKGYDVFRSDGKIKQDDFIKKIDALMYEDKERYRESKSNKYKSLTEG